MRVALFGHTGYVGKVLTHLLIDNYDLWGFSRSKLGIENEIQLDITSSNILDQVSLGSFDCLIIASAKLPTTKYDSEYFDSLLKTNIIGTRNAVLWAINNGVKKVIYLSSLSIIGEEAFDLGEVDESCSIYNCSQHYPYSLSKLGGEQVVRAECTKNNIEYNVLRVSSIYGNNIDQEGVIKTFFKLAKKGADIVIDSNFSNADFVHISDVSKAIASCINRSGYNGVVNIASGESTSILRLAEEICRQTKSKSSIKILSDDYRPKKMYSVRLMLSYLGVRDMISLEDGLCNLNYAISDIF